MIFSLKINKPFHPQVIIDQKHIVKVDSHKHLGVLFSKSCTWHDHLELTKSKALSRINVMHKLKFQLDRKSLQTIYFSFIRPLLEYADVVWNNCTQCESNELEKKTTTQIEAKKVAEWRSGYGVGFRTKGSLVRTPSGAHFVVALSKSH